MSWEALAGAVEWWADEGLRDVGRRRFHEARGKPVSPDAAPLGTVDRVRVAFVAQRLPWRLSEVALGTTNGDVIPAVASWADAATAVLTGSPAEQHVVGPKESWGDLGLRQMLVPTALEGLVPKPWTAEFRVPGEVLERDVSVLPEFVSLGTDYYEVSYDAGLDILSAWRAVIDGAAVQRLVLKQTRSLARAFDTGGA